MAATNNTTTSGFVQVVADGVRLAYNQYGPPSAPNLVLIPGWAQTAAAFRKQVQHFQSRFRVTTYDHRGHGRVRQARLRVLVQLDLRDAALLGHSMGCAVIWAHRDLFPQQLRVPDAGDAVDRGSDTGGRRSGFSGRRRAAVTSCSGRSRRSSIGW